MYIDAIVVKGSSKRWGISIKQKDGGTPPQFVPMDLNDYHISFKVLGSPTADAKVLLEHIITQDTNRDTVGRIVDPNNGYFEFAISAEETNELGLGCRPISIALLDASTQEVVHILTHGGQNGEFNKLYIVQV